MVGSALRRIGEAVSRACLDPGAWQGVTDAVAATFPGAKAAIVGHDTTLVRNIPSVNSGYADEFVRSYAAHYSRTIPNLQAWTSLPLGHVAQSSEIVPEEDLLRSEYYNDWLRPQGDPRHAAIAVLQRDPGRMFLFTAQVEHRAANQVLPSMMRVARGIYPLMRHALEINRMTLGLRIDSALLRSGVEPNRAAVLLLSAYGGVLYANKQAENLLAEGAVIHYDLFGRLRFAEADAAARLATVLDPRQGNKSLTFQTGGQRQRRDVRLIPLTPDIVSQVGVPLLMSAPGPSFLVVLRLASRGADTVQHISTRLGLTRAEAEVAIALAGGATTAEVAEARGVSVYTVRDQVKAALGKTGSRRQADLVRAVEALRHTF